MYLGKRGISIQLSAKFLFSGEVWHLRSGVLGQSLHRPIQVKKIFGNFCHSFLSLIVIFSFSMKWAIGFFFIFDCHYLSSFGCKH